MSENVKSRVAVLAAKGVPDAQIAEAVQVTAGYLTQLKQDEEYKHIYNKVVEANKLKTLPTSIQIDDNYNEIELRMSKFVLDNTATLVSKMLASDSPMQVFSALQKINGMTRRGAGEVVGAATHGENVTLELPAFLVPQEVPSAVHTANNEVVQVGDHSLTSISGKGLRGLAAKLNAEKQETSKFSGLNAEDITDIELSDVAINI